MSTSLTTGSSMNGERSLVMSALAGALLFASTATVVGETEPDPSANRIGSGSKREHAPYPEPDAGYVTDLAGLLSPDEQERIEVWLWQTESRTNVEIVVVTLDSIGDYPGTANGSIEAFARGLFDAYGIGNMPENDGVLLLIAKRDRNARVELGAGYGRTRDRDADRIMQNQIIARFRKGRFAEGVTEGVRAIMLEFAGVRSGFPWSILAAGVAIPVLGAIAYSLFRNGKRGWGWICVGLIIVLMLFILRKTYTVIRHLPESRSDSWGSGGFGGGGATGSW
ncbi:MAG: hypothetical protein CMJ18_04080 [Phycisphaeraceae bacterium]|nr:hypothetical protein [Phycisphaeraceae bacterium]